MSVPKKEYEDYDPLKDFDVYNDIKRKLVTLGVPAEEVAYIHSAKTDQQKQDMFDRVRRGEIRVLIGSTEKCGAGTNIQNKLIALHHLDSVRVIWNSAKGVSSDRAMKTKRFGFILM